MSAESIAASKSQAIRPRKQLIDIHKERNEQVNLKVSLVVEIYRKICQFHHQMSLAVRDQGAAGLGAVLLRHSSCPQVISCYLYHWLFPLELEDLPNSPSAFFALHYSLTGTSPAGRGRSHDLHALSGTLGGDPVLVLGCPRLGSTSSEGTANACVAVFELRRLC